MSEVTIDIPESRDIVFIKITSKLPLSNDSISSILSSVAESIKNKEVNEVSNNSNLGEDAQRENNRGIDDTGVLAERELQGEQLEFDFEGEYPDLPTEAD